MNAGSRYLLPVLIPFMLCSTGCSAVGAITKNYTGMLLALILIGACCVVAAIPFLLGSLIGQLVHQKNTRRVLIIICIVLGIFYFRNLPLQKDSEPGQAMAGESVDSAPEDSPADEAKPKPDNDLGITPATAWVKDADFHWLIHYQPRLIYACDRIFVNYTLGRFPQTPLFQLVWILSIPAFLVRLIAYYLIGTLIGWCFVVWPPTFTLAAGIAYVGFHEVT